MCPRSSTQYKAKGSPRKPAPVIKDSDEEEEELKPAKGKSSARYVYWFLSFSSIANSAVERERLLPGAASVRTGRMRL